jgi:quinol monooxygenase YgiN
LREAREGEDVSEPIVFISRFGVKEGKAEALRKFIADGARALEEEKPGTVAFLPYLDGSQREATIVHVFPDAEAMDAHFEGAEERSRASSEFLEPRGFEIYGTPSGKSLAMLREATSTHHVVAMAGFLRPAPGTVSSGA